MQRPNISARRQDPVPPPGDREAPQAATAADAISPSGWICLRNCNLGGRTGRPIPIPFVLLHPEVGVALLELAPGAASDAEGILRRRLEAARFDGIFPGHLPIVHLRVARDDLPALDSILHEAFAAVPPLSIPGGDAWVRVVERALSPRDPARGAPPAPPPGGGGGGNGEGGAGWRRALAEASADQAAAPQVQRSPAVPVLPPDLAVAAPAPPPPARGASAAPTPPPPARDASPERAEGPEPPLASARKDHLPSPKAAAAPAPGDPAAAAGAFAAGAGEPMDGRRQALAPNRPRGTRPWLWAGGGLVVGAAATGLAFAVLRGMVAPPPGDAPTPPRVATAPAATAPASDPGSAEGLAERAARAQAAPFGATGGQAVAPPAATGPAGAPAAGGGAPPRLGPLPSEIAATQAARGPSALAPGSPLPPLAEAAALGGGAAVPPATGAEPVARAVVRTPANLRTAPDLGGRVLRTAPRGEGFLIHGRAPGGWTQVGDETGPQGWIHSSLLTEFGP